MRALRAATCSHSLPAVAVASGPRSPFCYGARTASDAQALLRGVRARWDFTLGEAADGAAVVLDVAVGRFLDSSLLAVDVQPHLVRVLIKGRLLQLILPAEVSSATAAPIRAHTGAARLGPRWASQGQGPLIQLDRPWKCDWSGISILY